MARNDKQRSTDARCSHKVLYSNQAGAATAAEGWRRQPLFLRPYRCHFCNGWHLSTDHVAQAAYYEQNPPKYRGNPVKYTPYRYT